MIEQKQKFLFIGASGMGMTPLACWMSCAGYSVTGFDLHLKESARIWLTQTGVELRDIMLPEQVGEFSTVVYSSAFADTHPLLMSAQELGIRCIRRGEMLAEIAHKKKLIAVVGSHGKTTTSGMIVHSCLYSGIEVGYILGGLFLDKLIPPARYTSSDWLIAEVDESDGTIDLFEPEITLVLNIDWDHCDYYDTANALELAFTKLFRRTRQKVIAPSDLTLESIGPAIVQHFDGSAKNMDLDLVGYGRLNKVNSDAAASVLALFNCPLRKDSLSSFLGMSRRQTTLYHNPDFRLIEDYAHHPTEIDALIELLRINDPDKKLIIVFQPHRYTRTRRFKDTFVSSLLAADQVFLLPVYEANESPLDGGTTEDLSQAFTGQSPLNLNASLSGMHILADALQESPSQLAFVGAGDIEDFAASFTSWMRSCRLKGESIDIAFFEYLKPRLSPSCRLKLQEPLANKTTIKIGGTARFFAEPANLSDLLVLLRAGKLFEFPTFCLGRGSNILISDQGFDGLIIRFFAPVWRHIQSLGQGRIWAAAGGRLKEICGFATKYEISGFEFLEGIPGVVGGALSMNAGAMGSWIFDLVERVQFIDEFGLYQDLPKSAFHFGYRKVDEISRGIALSAILCGQDNDNKTAICGRIDNYSSTRKESQPRAASAGCIFKNPDGGHAGKLIDDLGIKGMSVGGAEVSKIHGNFIVNNGGAKAADVIELVRRIRSKVKAESGYLLEPEVLLVGQSWDDALRE